jgi:hypothetical protein
LTPQEVLFAAGQRAAQWYIDTGDCLFCAVDSAPKGHTHERHCTFYGISDTALKEFLGTLPEPQILDD